MNKATKEAPKPYPTISIGTSPVLILLLVMYKSTNSTVTPKRHRVMLRTAEKAPPRKQTINASPYERRAAAATRMFECDAHHMLRYPERAEQTQPSRNEMEERKPR